MDTVVTEEGARLPAEAPTVLATKTTVPVVRGDLLARPRLTSILTEADTPLLVVVAPAGWGKTTLLAQWARQQGSGHPLGWLTLDSTDNDPHRFWTYVISALRRAGGVMGESALAALGIPGLDPMAVAVPHLLNDLAGSETPHTIVLDDYHLIEAPPIIEAVEYLITYLPPTARVVIGARSDPPLPLARWRGRGRLTEVRAEQLRFDEEEIRRLLALEPDQAEELLARTEGWAAGVQLVAMAMRGTDDPTRVTGAIRGDHRHLIDYVSSEVLAGLGERQRDLMMRSSVLDQVCGSLVDHVLETEGSARLLQELADVDPFISRLDEGGTWYRWHPIMRDALRRELDRIAPQQRAEVLARAGGWYLERGQYEPAIRHLIAAGHTSAAVALLLRHEDEFLDAGNIGIFLALADSLGVSAIAGAPDLALAMAWAAFVSGARDRVDGLLDMAEASSLTGSEPAPNGWSTVVGSASALRALAGEESVPGWGRAEIRAREAVAAESDPSLPGYSVARFALGLAMVNQGRVEDAVGPLQEAWDRSDASGMPAFARLPMAGVLASVLIDLGRAGEADSLIRGSTPLVRRLETALGSAAGPAVGALRLAEARLELEDGDRDTAREMLEAVIEQLRVAGHPGLTARGLLIRAGAEMESASTETARQAVAEAREIARNDPLPPAISALLDAMENRLGRAAVRSARGDRRLFEELTDRELSILRALDGPLSQREIGRELYLSINTVKGYTKSLYRKLGAGSRAEAVERGRGLGII